MKRSRLPRAALGAVASVLLPLALARPARAGTGPETTVVVVNAASPTSWRLANAYVRARGIPATHVVAIDGVPTLTTIDVDTFRSRLWGPVKAALEARGLLERTDVVAWSADFPYGVRFDADKPAKDLGGPPFTPVASLTSMTYLARRVEAKDADGYLGMTVNGYYRRYPGEASSGARDLTEAEAALRNEALARLLEKGWEKAAAAYRKLLETWNEDAETHYNYGCCLARLGKADEAMAALEAAFAHGFSSASHAREDADLESLRGRADFQALLGRMEAAQSGGVQPSRGFRAADAWTGGVEPAADPASAPNDRYRLSTMLAYTGEWGNSFPEAWATLEAAIGSDGTDPKGTFYFLANSDVRATTRMPRFQAAVDALRAMGRKAEILSKDDPGQTGVLPIGKDDVLGACIGSAGFVWKDAKSRILPGAICEHLTSFGAVFDNGGQTKLTELVRSGAAGASGTVYEPYAIQNKFPVPHVQVHYAAGCSLAEAFYQSVWGPYQLLIVGDPLARPFAKIVRVDLALPATVSGSVALAPTVAAAEGHPIGTLELWVDGAFVASGAPGAPLSWDTTKAEDGAHDVRVVAVEAGPIATRSSAAATTVVQNGKAVGTLEGPKSVAYDGSIALSGRAPGAAEVEVLAGARVLATIPLHGDAWRTTVTPSRLGLGTTTLQARAKPAKGAAFRSGFLEVTVNPPPMRAAQAPPKKASKPGPAPAAAAAGLSCEVVPAEGKPVTFALASLGGSGQPAVQQAIEAKVKGASKSITLTGEMEIPVAGLYELVVDAAGSIDVDVDGKPCLDERVAADRQAYGLAHLDAGWHAIRIRYVPSGPPTLTVLLGGDVVTRPLAGASIRHGGR